MFLCILQLTLSSTVCHSRTEELLSVESLPSQWLMLVNVGKRRNSMHSAFFFKGNKPSQSMLQAGLFNRL